MYEFVTLLIHIRNILVKLTQANDATVRQPMTRTVKETAEMARKECGVGSRCSDSIGKGTEMQRLVATTAAHDSEKSPPIDIEEYAGLESEASTCCIETDVDKSDMLRRVVPMLALVNTDSPPNGKAEKLESCSIADGDNIAHTRYSREETRKVEERQHVDETPQKEQQPTRKKRKYHNYKSYVQLTLDTTIDVKKVPRRKSTDTKL